METMLCNEMGTAYIRASEIKQVKFYRKAETVNTMEVSRDVVNWIVWGVTGPNPKEGFFFGAFDTEEKARDFTRQIVKELEEA